MATEVAHVNAVLCSLVTMVCMFLQYKIVLNSGTFCCFHSFQCCSCRVVLHSERCEPGQFYSRERERCELCPRDSYQPIAGQNFCIDCPGYTQTDTNGANSTSQCKGTLSLLLTNKFADMVPRSLYLTLCSHAGEKYYRTVVVLKNKKACIR